jgi:hypothetical protein
MAQVQCDVERTRADLVATVDELANRADVKARARAKAAEAKQRTRAKVRQAGRTLREQAGIGCGAVVDAARRREVRWAAGGAAAVVLLLVVRARRS